MQAMKNHLVLHREQTDGSTLFEHCKKVYDKIGEWPSEFPLPEIPEAVLHIWHYYWELRNCASYGFNGPNPLSYTDILSWLRLFQIDIPTRDLLLLLSLDREYLSFCYSEQKKKSKAKK